MSDYSGIDPVLISWAQRRGLHVYTGNRQNVVRSITIYVWNGSRHDSTGHIWLDPPSELGIVGLHAANCGFRLDEAVPLSGLEAALEAACERLAAQTRLAEAR
jgi:hypothetical protein